MSFSIEELERAWLHVEQNAGCPGVDAVSVARFAKAAPAELALLRQDLSADRYKPLPWLEMLLEKTPGPGTRRLLIPAVRDRVLQTAVAMVLEGSLDQEFSDVSFAYRRGRSVDSAIARMLQLRDRGFTAVLDCDIEGFFDSVDHARLLDMLEGESATKAYVPLIRAWLHAPYWDGETLHPMGEGIPQGSPVSPVLANFFLEPFDLALAQSDAHLVRYADDFVLLCSSIEQARNTEVTVRAALEKQGLRLNSSKTRVTSFTEGFTFLGVFFLGDKTYTPWKHEHTRGKVLFLARVMPAAALAKYIGRHSGRPSKRPAARHSHAVSGLQSDQRGVMAFLYLTEQGSIVRKSGDRILVEKDAAIVLDLPYHKLERILLFGNVQLTSAAMTELLDHGIGLSLFTRQGRFRGALVPPSAKNIELRLAHFDGYRDPAATFELARKIVGRKIENGCEVLRRLARKRPEAGAADTIATLEECHDAIASAGAIQALDGVEGSAAREYFGALMQFNLSPFPWPGRIKHPAPDPINALLSLTYTLLMHELMGLLDAAGLDPYLGFLHQLEHGRPSLALDLVEAFRHPVADRFVIAVLNQGFFGPDDFRKAPDRDGLFLEHEAIKRYFNEYEKWMLTAWDSRPAFRQSLKAEVESLVRHFRGGPAWEPYRYGASPEEEEVPAGHAAAHPVCEGAFCA